MGTSPLPMRLASLLALLLLAAPLAAQPTPACEVGTAEAELYVGDVRATLYNIGGLFWRGSPQYEVPVPTFDRTVFAAGLWVSGRVDGEHRFAGSTYGPWDFWPGPPAADGTTTAERCAAYDRIWTVGTDDLEAYAQTGVPPPALAEWPVGIGAPFYVDANGNGAQDAGEPTRSLDPGDPGYETRTLDLAAGERPVVFGRRTAWWVMNDVGGEHRWGGTDPLGIEVRATAWAVGGSVAPELVASTFYRYEVINRSAATLDTLRIAMFNDVDMRDRKDDLVHSDTTRQMLVVYDAESGTASNGLSNAFGMDALSGGARSAMMFYNGGGVTTDPGDAADALLFLQSRWRDGSPLRFGGNGYRYTYPNGDEHGTGPRAWWPYPGDPVADAYWSEENDGIRDEPRWGDDVKLVLPGAVHRLAPGERAVFDVGFLFAQAPDRLDAVTALRAVSDRAQADYASGALFAPVATPNPPPAPPLDLPADGAEIAGGPVRFEWAAAPEATEYLFELFADDPAVPVVSEWVEVPALTLDPLALPLNRRAPMTWRVRARVRDVVGPTSAPRALTYFVPAFDRFAVVANAAGAVDPAAPLNPFLGGFPDRGTSPEARQQTTGLAWALLADSVFSFPAFMEAAVDPALAFPHDFEVRFTGPHPAAVEGALYRLDVPFEVWDLGAGTPDDPADDVRLIPVLHDTDRSRTYSFGPTERDHIWATDPVSWHRPRDMAPGSRGHDAWAADPDAAPGPAVLERTVFARFVDQAGADDGRGPWPERGTVVRIESGTQTRAIEAGDGALALAVRPNPLATRGAVVFALAEAGPVRLRVVDALGRAVRTLAEGERGAGPHTVAFDAAGLAAGVYLVVLDAGGDRLARPLTVVR